MLRIMAFPAREGDCFLVEYGDPASPKRILIDGGRGATYRDHLRGFLERIPEGERRLDLFVITHIDRDHIEGALALAEDVSLSLAVNDVWFNAYPHLSSGAVTVLPPPRSHHLPGLSPLDGERLSKAIRARNWPWNKAFEGGPVSLGDGSTPVVRCLPEGAILRLLSPNAEKLEALAPVWRRECMRAGLAPGALAGAGGAAAGRLAVLRARTSQDLAAIAARQTPVDKAAPNGSSIAFVFEAEGRRVLFAADAHPELLDTSLQLQYGEACVALDLFKVSHHASRANLTESLCGRFECSEMLISTNGAMFQHPDEEALARLVLAPGAPKRLHFNYKTAITESWHDPALCAEYGFSSTFPEKNYDGFCTLDLSGVSLVRLRAFNT